MPTLSPPPNPPWRVHIPAEPRFAYACFYHSDDFARWPVRAITRVKDNKSDPNLETGTFGLFSTCERGARSGVVSRGPAYIFFVTRPRNRRRALVGYYEIGWFTEGSQRQRTRDYALAARHMRFISPIPLEELPENIGTTLLRPWRLQTTLNGDQTRELAELVNTEANRTVDYLDEIERMERINRYHSGFRYPTWLRREGWSWKDAEHYLGEALSDPSAPEVRNASSSGWWRCAHCEAFTENQALLRMCPHCHELDALRPAPSPSLLEA